jgi:ATP-binding cassette subfamily C exporter for protease/lipase
MLLGGPGEAIVASILGGRVLAPLAQLIGQWRAIGGVRSAYQRLGQLLNAVPVEPPGMDLPPPQGMLRAENLVVTPPGTKLPVLRGVSFAAQPGEVLAVIGASAAGKTSLARTLIGVWPSSGGKVRLDGADVFDWHKSQLGPHIGYLAQGVELFDGSVAENIARFGKVDIDLVRQAAEAVGITATIEELPEAFDTQIGDAGAVLSGGQRQRIGLARAIYGWPRFLVLDEPTASLDENGEKAFLALLQILKSKGCAVIVITHRASVLSAAEKLLLLIEGTVGKFGPRDQVIAELQAANAEAAAKAKGQAVSRPAPPAQTATQGSAA